MEENFYATELQFLMTIYSKYPCYWESGPVNTSRLRATWPPIRTERTSKRDDSQKGKSLVGGAIAAVPRISAEIARFSTRECFEFLTRSSAAVATGQSQIPITEDI